MQANIVRGGAAAFNALVYPPPSRSLIDYIGERVNSAVEASSMFGQKFVDNVLSIYNKFGTEKSVNEGRLLIHQAGQHLSDDVVYQAPYDSLGDANLRMQHYIMANPMVGELARKGMCHSFADTYINFEPSTYGEDTFLYQSVMDGVYDTENDITREYYHTEMDTIGLCSSDKVAILNTWDNVVNSIFNGIDPTDPDRGSL